MLTERSPKKELIDLGPDFYTESEYKHCLDKLFVINKWLGVVSKTTQFLKKINPSPSILDVGCGGGDVLIELNKKMLLSESKGIDLNLNAIHYANTKRLQGRNNNLLFTHDKLEELNQNYDCVLTTLVCHHLDESELVPFLKAAFKRANKVVLINDLHRHGLSYFLYWLVSPIFKNRLIRQDGLLSIKKGFKKNEWHTLLNQAGIPNYTIRWQFPFWWQVILWKN